MYIVLVVSRFLHTPNRLTEGLFLKFFNKNTSSNGHFDSDPSEMRKAPGYNGSVPGVNTPDIRLPGVNMMGDVSVPAYNPPVPNRAWTAMKMGMDITELSEEEKRDLYVGRDRLL